MTEPKVIQVQEPVLRAFAAAVGALNKSVEDAIREVAPDEMVAPVFERPEPIEHATSLAKTAEQNVGILRRLSKKAKEDGERAAAVAKRLTRIQKGQKPCKDCDGTGKDRKNVQKDCKACDGDGFDAAAA